jgi:hypothetical protein
MGASALIVVDDVSGSEHAAKTATKTANEITLISLYIVDAYMSFIFCLLPNYEFGKALASGIVLIILNLAGFRFRRTMTSAPSHQASQAERRNFLMIERKQTVRVFQLSFLQCQKNGAAEKFGYLCPLANDRKAVALIFFTIAAKFWKLLL